MASLYDRLKRSQPLPKREALPYEAELLVEEGLHALAEPLPLSLSGEMLGYISQGQVREEARLEDILFLDTETTGLSRGAGTVAFLIGYGTFENGGLRVSQVLMRDYPQEGRLLADFLERLGKARLVVTYNGAAFDLPLLQGRLTMNRLREDLGATAQLDLLHAARRVYKLRLGRLPLGRMEEEVLGFAREGDLPGAEVPQRYFAYLEKRDEGLLRDVLDHNRQDIISLARLLLHLHSAHEQPLALAHQQDIFSLGRAYERQGQASRAITCYKACSDKTVRDLARLRVAEVYKKERRNEEAAQALEDLRRSAAADARVYISLAKIYEHRFRDPARALEIARQGMLYCSQRLGFSESGREYEDLEKRALRLMRKVKKSHESD